MDDSILICGAVFDTPIGFGILFLVYVLIGLPLAGGILYVAYYLLTLPLRRNERSRVFLDLLELGLKDGRTPEAAVLEATDSRDPGLGRKNYLLAAHLRSGLRLSEALERVPQVLPPQIRAMLKAGERIGDIVKVLPACRQLLRDGVSQVRGAHNYLILLAFCVTPITLLIPIIIAVKVLPQFQMIFNSMGLGSMPAFSMMVFSQGHGFLIVQTAFLLLLWALMVAYIGGPRLREWTSRLLPGAPDALAILLPWKRKRLQRDFSSMLAMLLDASVPEAEAVTIAVEATANRAMIRRGNRMRELLAQGVKLPVALREMDDSGELRWRIANALQARGGFLRALTGWHEALDAKAFQVEQATAQVATTALVLANGAMVACVVIAVFLLLINLINEACLW